MDLVQRGRVLVAGKIVHDEDVTRTQGWSQQPVDVRFEDPRVRWPVGNHRCARALIIDCMDQRCCFPMPMGNAIVNSLIAGPPAIPPRHVRLRAGFVEEDEFGDVQAILASRPSRAFLLYVRTLLLTCTQLFFCVYVPNDATPPKSL